MSVVKGGVPSYGTDIDITILCLCYLAARKSRSSFRGDRHNSEVGNQKLFTVFCAIRYVLWMATAYSRRKQHRVTSSPLLFTPGLFCVLLLCDKHHTLGQLQRFQS